MRYAAFLVVLWLTACGTAKKLGPVPDRSDEEVLAALRKRNIDFKYFNGKIGTSLESPDENISGSMQVKMVRDSAVWVAIKKFGIEAARMYADRSGYTVLYRFESVYETGSMSQINNIIGITTDFSELQQLLFGNVVLPEGKPVVTRDSLWYVVSAFSEGLALRYFVNGYDLQLHKLDVVDPAGRKASLEYGDYRKVDGYGKVAFERTAVFPYSEQGDATLKMNFSEFEINVPRQIKFSIPDNYEKIN